MNKVPVLFMMFNRPDITAEAFKHIREYKPDKLYLAADGPREGRNEESKCEETRNRIESLIDWECKIHRLYRADNLGCDEAVYGAICWFFEQEEYGIIVEDDIVLGQDFYKMCEELLPLYHHSDDIMMITSQFLGNKKDKTSFSYGFSNYSYIWGWATWRRAWDKMDMQMKTWPQITFWSLYKQYGFVRALFFRYYYWKDSYKKVLNNEKSNPWDCRWAFSMFYNNGLSITPYVNLSKNIGCTGSEGTHYSLDDKDLYEHLVIHSIKFPMCHPAVVKQVSGILSVEQKDFIRIRMHGLRKILRRKMKGNKKLS